MITPVAPPTGRPLVLAVTGTNGKTSVSSATLQLLRAIGWPAAGYDSTGITDLDGVTHTARVRRSVGYLPQLIAYQAQAGARAVAVEAFVGLLAEGMFAHVEVDTAVCTGLELDHLDVHKSPENYWAAKLSLFDRHLRPDGIAVMPVDCARGVQVRAAVARRGAKLVTLGEAGDVALMDVRTAADRLFGRLVIHGDAHDVELPFVHRIAVTNALLAAIAVIGAGGRPSDVVEALSGIVPPPGRLQTAAQDRGIHAMVDTAHNPGALRTALAAVRERAAGRVLLVFGAGGERDAGKRAEMGRVAAAGADLVVLTDDNPRRESPGRIRSQVRTGCPNCIEIPRRSDAIAAAIRMAKPGDVVLVAGKGDETRQLVDGKAVEHDDREVIRKVMAELGSSNGA